MKKNDYKKATQKISKYLLNKDILSAYEYGSYKNPGLSDIDLFIIIKNKKYNLLKKIIDDLKKKDLSFFFEYSTIMIADTNFLKNIILFDNLNLKKIFGKKIDINKYKSYKKELELLSVLEWIPERTLRLRENIDNFNKVNLRQHLGLLNSLKYTYIKLNHYISETLINLFCKKIDQLRKDKDILKKRHEILIFSKKILKYTQSLMYRFSEDLSVKNLNIKINGELIMTFPNNYKIFFTNKQNLRPIENTIFVPLIYSSPFAFHLTKKNSLYRTLKGNFKLLENYKINYKNKKINFILNKRNKLISNNIDLLKKNNLIKGIYKFGWYLKKYEKKI